MISPPMARWARITPILAALASLAICGVSSATSAVAKRPARHKVSKYLPPRRANDANKGEVGIANGSNHAIDCKIPRYRSGAIFKVDDQSTRLVRAADISGDKVIDEVMCEGKTVDGLHVTPDTGGEDVAYLADGKFQRSGYIYLHADLRPEYANVCRSTGPDETVPWATSPNGFCGGDFTGGSPPFDRAHGLSFWSKKGDGYVIVTALGTFNGYVTHPGRHFDCYVFSRASGDCYTQDSQMGKPRNTQGGPLYIDVHLGQAVNPAYLLVRGWCQKSDGYCIPH